jgi:hypothetical protein
MRDAAEYCGYRAEYLSRLARTGQLNAVKINGIWLTTLEALTEYLGKK